MSIKEDQLEKRQDIRVLATRQIWSFATGMLAICMIFGGSNKSNIPPIVITVCAAISTAFVWKSDKKNCQQLSPSQLQKLEERLANLETIAGNGDLELGNKMKQLEISDVPVNSFNSRQM